MKARDKRLVVSGLSCFWIIDVTLDIRNVPIIGVFQELIMIAACKEYNQTYASMLD